MSPDDVAHPQSQRPTPRDIVIPLDILSVIMKDEFSVSVQIFDGRGAIFVWQYWS